jgi:hypothetical protein
MNIKSLLLGSAAALVAVSGARAADAVMAEPEAVEYVRVCDAYGAGYFYIPGTETCLKIAGRVRYQIDFSDADNGWRKNANAMLNFTAKSDTELGTLTSYIELGFGKPSNGTGPGILNGGYGSSLGVDHAWISLGGLKMGYSDTLFDGSINGEFDSFGGAGIDFVGYTFTGGNGFSATLNLEEEDYNVNYVPNIVGKLSYSQGMFGVDLWAAYDDADLDKYGATSEFSLKGIATIKPTDAFALQIGATYNSGQNFYSNGADWSVGASGKYTVSEKLALTAGAQYFGGDYTSTNGEWAAGVVVDYTVVPNFLVELAVNYKSDDNTGVVHGDTVDGYLRFQRSF